MRHKATIVGLVLASSVGTARAQDPVPTAAEVVAPPAASERRIEVVLSLLPMGMGKYQSAPGGHPMTADAAFSYGAALQASFAILPELTVGLAPQVFYNVKAKEDPAAGSRQVDLMARVAYTLHLVDTIGVYAEVLPGYSLISPPGGGDLSRGPVVAFGVGALMELTDRVFANLGVGYEVGFQKTRVSETRTRYVRLALGVGARF